MEKKMGEPMEVMSSTKRVKVQAQTQIPTQ